MYAGLDEDGAEAAIKFVPVEPGADRELLLTEMDGRQNVVAVLDHGTVDGHHVIVMPRAKKSLRQHLEDASGPLALDEVREVAGDVGLALQSLQPDIVHRDLKPENVLLLDDTWVVTDFGISRYVDASTATHTRAGFFTPQYLAPERWRNERAKAATDVYALGIMMYEMLAGRLPFEGRSIEDFAEAHLGLAPPPLEGVPPTWVSLVDECLSKSPAARPTVDNLLARLSRMTAPDPATGLGALAAMNASVVRERAEADVRRQRQQAEGERRERLFTDAARRFDNLATAVMEELQNAAPSGEFDERHRQRLFALGRGRLEIIGPKPFAGWTGDMSGPAFDVAAFAHIAVDDVKAKSDGSYYYGRSHSLWFGDAQENGSYAWFETAFMDTPFGQQRRRDVPFALNPDVEHAVQAVGNVVGAAQVAWPFEPFTADTLELFIERWSNWLSQAAAGRLQQPSKLPERSPEGSWRR